MKKSTICETTVKILLSAVILQLFFIIISVERAGGDFPLFASLKAAALSCVLILGGALSLEYALSGNT